MNDPEEGFAKMLCLSENRICNVTKKVSTYTFDKKPRVGGVKKVLGKTFFFCTKKT